MKILFSLSCFLAGWAAAVPAQDTLRGWSVSAGYTYERLLEGYVFVKGVNTAADTLSFGQDLNINSWHHVFLGVKKTFGNRLELILSAERFFYASTAGSEKDIYHNDLVLDGRAGVSTGGSRVWRGLLLLEGPVSRQSAPLRLSWSAGVLYDHMIFKLRGQITNSGNPLNFREDFNDQFVPSLVFGGKLEWNPRHSARSRFILGTFGSFIPSRVVNRLTGSKFEYTSINAALGYRHEAGRFFIHPKITARHMYSQNDNGRHVFKATNGGVQVEGGVRF